MFSKYVCRLQYLKRKLIVNPFRKPFPQYFQDSRNHNSIYLPLQSLSSHPSLSLFPFLFFFLFSPYCKNVKTCPLCHDTCGPLRTGACGPVSRGAPARHSLTMGTLQRGLGGMAMESVSQPAALMPARGVIPELSRYLFLLKEETRPQDPRWPHSSCTGPWAPDSLS